MNIQRLRKVAWFPSFILAGILFAASSAAAQETALDRYVAKPDPSYSWKLVNTIAGQGYKGFVIDLTSQTWRSAAEVDRPAWKHWLTIVKPDKMTSTKALLFIGGGDNGDPQPTTVNERLVGFATQSGTVVAELGMVPNQPLFFADSKDKGRSEDDSSAGRDSRVHGERRRRPGEDRRVRRFGRLEARVDYMACRVRRQTSHRDHADGDRRVEL